MPRRLHDPQWLMNRLDDGTSVNELARELNRDGANLYRFLRRHFPDWKPDGRWGRNFRVPENPIDLGYLAGLMDGEGSISLVASSHTSVRIGMTDKEVIDWLSQWGGTVYHDKRSLRIPHRKDCWTWNVFRRYDVIALLVAVLPYMKLEAKKERARIAISRFPPKPS